MSASPTAATLHAVKEFLRRQGIERARIKLLKAAPDRVYQISPGSPRRTALLLRLRGPSNALSSGIARLQSRWLTSLAKNTAVTAPRPVPIGSRPFRSLKIDGESQPVQAAMFTWVEGRRTHGPVAFVQPHILKALGASVATLHRHAETFNTGSNDDRPSLRRDANHRLIKESWWLSGAASGKLHKREVEAIKRTQDRIRRAMNALGESRRHFGLIHGDLEPPNWVFKNREARPIDFESLCQGHYLFDLAQVLWTHSMWKDHDEYRRVLLEAYERIRPLSAAERTHLKTFESIPLFEWIHRRLRENTPESLAELRQWMAPTLKRMRELCEA